MKVYLKTEDEIELMRQANHLIALTFAELAGHIKPGVSTLDLDKVAEEFIRDHGAIPSFKNFPNPGGTPFPGSICTSVNDVVVHGVPNKETVLKEGDIISVDCGTILNGYNGDSCYTYCVGEVSEEAKALLRTTKESLYKGIAAATAGNHLGDIGAAVQDYCESHDYGVVRELVGHGIGREMHEDPQVPNYGKRGNGMKLKEGMCIAIEPMITQGERYIGICSDGWTVKTQDGKLAAHYEHSIVIRKGKAEILSSFDEVEKLTAPI